MVASESTPTKLPPLALNRVDAESPPRPLADSDGIREHVACVQLQPLDAQSVTTSPPTTARSRRGRRRPRPAAGDVWPSGTFGEYVPVSETAPSWWLPPPAVVRAAERYDTKHKAHMCKAERALRLVADDLHSTSKRAALDLRLDELRRHRFFVPDVLHPPPRTYGRKPPPARPQPARPPVAWSLETSIWSPRRRWCDGRAFHDTPELMARAFEADWSAACRGGGLAKFVASSLARSSGGKLSDAQVAAAMEEVASVLRRHCQLIYSVFDWYAFQGSSADVFQIQLNAYTSMLNDCALVEEGSKHTSSAHLDGLFIAVNSATSAKEDKYNHKRGVNRQVHHPPAVRPPSTRHAQPPRNEARAN